MQNLEWHTEKRKINDLIPFDGNPRQLTEKQVADLKRSLEKFNLVEIPAITLSNKILAGHQRLKIMQVLGRGEEVIDVRVPSRELSTGEEQEYLLRSNKNVGEWNWDDLANFDEEILREAGFTEEELLQNFGLNDADQIEVEKERMEVITVETPEAPRIFSRQSFYFDNIEDFEKVKEFFKGAKDGRLDVAKLVDLLKTVNA